MNIALRYFGGNKKYFMPFIVLFAAYALIELYLSFDRLPYFFSSHYQYLIFGMISNIVSLLLLAVMWLFSDKRIFIAAYSITVLYNILRWVMTFTISDIANEIKSFFSENAFRNRFLFPQTVAEIVSCVAFLVAVLLIWLKSVGKIKRIAVFMVILFIPISGMIANIMPDYDRIPGFRLILHDYLPGFLLIAVLIALWIPLNKFLICPKCGRRNNKVAGFCGGCGSPLK